ncbi:RIP metalloprotease RseP [uncultured Flavobacterium sp.]|uniref:RIP metalloprotease RseP n=1 Tax=uncultured Flavobacterium sp. TaxID=165435 RepID=UPI0025F2955D|nr:RIP metalloprotease RseP [uncultured Flavobacterium sp.]
MDIVVKVAQMLLMLSILVILHEFGHYITAKWFKVRVEKFYLFMDAGFSLVKKKIGETEWGIGWLPLGGYVKLSGMIDESMDTEQMKTEPQPWEFRAKPAWQRLIIMLGGIIVNVLLAWLIFSVVYSTYGKKYISTEIIQEKGLVFGETGKKVGFKNGDRIISVDGKYQKNFNRMMLDVLLGDEIVVQREGRPVTLHLSDADIKLILQTEGRNFMHPLVKNIIVDSVAKNSNAEKAGLMAGDRIVSVGGSEHKYFGQLNEEAFKHKNGTLSLGVLRNGQTMTITAAVDSLGKIGMVQKPEFERDYDVVENYNFFSAVPVAMRESYDLIIYNVKQFKLILRPSTGAYEQVNSVIGIAAKLPSTWNWEFFWNFTALFSIGLAFMNLLPIPGLDGGHALFTIAEMITGRRLGDKAAGTVQTVGMIILLSLMALTFGKDIYQLIFK